MPLGPEVGRTRRIPPRRRASPPAMALTPVALTPVALSTRVIGDLVGCRYRHWGSPAAAQLSGAIAGYWTAGSPGCSSHQRRNQASASLTDSSPSRR